MTYASLLTLLRQLCPTYEEAAPAGLTRYVTASLYGSEAASGDDGTLWEFPKVQLDVWAQQPRDRLFGDVRDLLQAWSCPYQMIARVYDDDLAMFRMILQLEVLAE